MFLDIPPHTRHRVYRMSGLEDQNFGEIDRAFRTIETFERCEFWLDRRCSACKINVILCDGFPQHCNGWGRHLKDQGIPRIALPPTLLTLNRVFHKEILEDVFSTHVLSARICSPFDLSQIHDMLPLVLSRLSCLIIHLRPKYDDGHNDHSFAASFHFLCDIPKTLVRSQHDEKLVKDWDTLCLRLAMVLAPDQLHLTLIAPKAKFRTAQSLCQSIYHLPALKDCYLNLGGNRNLRLSELVRLTAQRKVSTRRQQSFNFFGLPIEIRLLVLSHSHLVPTENSFPLTLDKGSSSWYITRGICCENCNDIQDCCFCPWSGAAYSASCTCPIIPENLFKVSKQMRAEAEIIFFESRRFEFPLAAALDSSKFLSGFQTHFLRSLRHIHYDTWQVHDWRGALDPQHHLPYLLSALKQFMYLPRLCLSITTDLNSDVESKTADQLGDEKHGWYEREYNLISNIGIMLLELRGSGLQDLHVKTSWFRPMERVIETAVMGERYDSYTGNRLAKGPVERRDWLAAELPSYHAERWERRVLEWLDDRMDG